MTLDGIEDVVVFRIDQAVAVVVDPVADLIGSGADVGVGVVAVLAAELPGGGSVAIPVERHDAEVHGGRACLRLGAQAIEDVRAHGVVAGLESAQDLHGLAGGLGGIGPAAVGTPLMAQVRWSASGSSSPSATVATITASSPTP